MKLSDLKPEDVQVESAAPTAPLKLSSLGNQAQFADGEPGVKAIGVQDGPTPAYEEGTIPKLTRYLKNSFGTVGKTLDAPRAVTGAPLMNQLVEALSGKKTGYGAKDFVQGVNPLNLKTAPNTADMLKRVGMQDAEAPVTDSLFSMAKGGNPDELPQNQNVHSFAPSTVGTLGAVGDYASDPLTYLTLGLGRPVKAATTAAQDVFNAAKNSGVMSEISNAGKNIVAPGLEAAQNMGSKLKNAYPGLTEGLSKILNAPSAAAKSLGERLYSSAIQPIEFEGLKRGKTDVAKTMYDAGISNPFNADKKAADAANALLAKRGEMFANAGEKGATVDINKAVEGASEKAAQLRSLGDPSATSLADRIDETIQAYKTHSQKTPYTPQTASDLKSFLYNELPGSTWTDASKTSVGNAAKSKVAGGIKGGIEDAVENTLGKGQGEAVANLNEQAGNLLSTRGAQKRVAQKAEHMANNVVTPTGADTLLAALKDEGHGEGLNALLLRKGMEGLRLGTMPVGYGLQKLSEGALTSPMLNNYIRRKYIDLNANPPQGDQQ